MVYRLIFPILLIIKFISISKSQSCDSTDSVLIESSIGKLEGLCSIVNANTDKKKLYTWLAIPYAEPPTKDKRFKPPEPKKSMSEIYKANKVPNSCMQLFNKKISQNLEFTLPFELKKDSISKISEDCLYLNIYAPASDDFMVKKKPIMVVIHGGDGTTGSGSLDIHEPSIFATMTNTIVVTFNYRLGAFGFLRIEGSDDAQGNQGFLDQNLALKWIHENAEKFGGDNSKITLMGYGTGARFIGMHLIYKPSHPFFRNVIVHSGSTVNIADNLLSKNAANKRVEHFIKTFYKDCGSNKVECLRNKDAANITMDSFKFLVENMSNKSLLAASKIDSLFKPIVDGKIITESPSRAFRTGNFKQCKFIIGFNSNEGASEIPLDYGLVTNKNQLKKLKPRNGVLMKQIINFEQFVIFIKKYYKFYPIYPMDRNMKKIQNTIIKAYTGFTMESYRKNAKQKSNYFFDLRTLLTDEGFACPTFKMLDYIARKNEVFTYVYNHRLSTSKYPVWYGVVKGDELASAFGQPFRIENNNKVSNNPWLETDKKKYSVDDKKISLEMMTRWANFVHGNNPNVKSTNNKWPVFKSNSSRSSKLYMGFTQNETKVMKLQNTARCNTWNKELPFIVSNS